MLDILFIADPRFPGGTSTALASEITAAGRAGLSCALMPVRARVLKASRPVNDRVASAMAASGCRWAAPDEVISARLALAHHQAIFDGRFASPLQVHVDAAVLVLHHPPFDGDGALQYNLPAAVASADAALGTPPALAPVGPIVRRQLERLPGLSDRLPPFDWHNLIDTEMWPARSPYQGPSAAPLGADGRRMARVGRHSRPDPLKFPDDLETALAAYPDDGGLQVSMLGAGDFLRDAYGALPAHWDVLPFGSIEVSEYLRSLDFYVYFHHSSWVESFGLAPLEALATGLVTILPPSFEPLFGDGAVYARPDEVAALIEWYRDRPADCAAQSERARRRAERFGLSRFADRLQRILPPASRPAAPPPAVPRRRPRALMVTSNGVGLGHLTRQLAIADAASTALETRFLTLSGGADLVSRAGYPMEYRPFHRLTGANTDAWNRALLEEINDVLAFFSPDILVFDGNHPYDGLRRALSLRPWLKSVWVRRGFWAPRHAAALKHAAVFSAVLEPGDIAERWDTGPTAARKAGVFRTDPIVRGAPDERLPRAAARRALDLPAAGLAVGVSIGAGANYDYNPLRDALIDGMTRLGAEAIVEFVSPLSPSQDAEDPRVIRRDAYPIFPFSRAFDFMISGCGYNSFHEAMYGGVPTIFCPNEAEEMDLQVERARYAAAAGAALVVRRADSLGVHHALRRMLDPATRARLGSRARALAGGSGARAAARFVIDHAHFRQMRPDPAP